MSNNKSKILLIIIVSGVMVMLVALLMPEKDKNDSLVKLNASVTFDENRFFVCNNDTIDYLNVQLTVDRYYTITDMNLSAGETYTFWPVEFSHINGRRLPANTKPQQFAIWCRLAGGANGFYSVKF